MMQAAPCRALVRSLRKFIKPQLSKQLVPRRSLASVIEQSPEDPTEYDEISTLPNGLRVATEALPGPFAGVGVYVDAGSRWENEELCGVSHIADRLAFKSTGTRSSNDFLEQMETLGGNIQCASSRESIMYQAASFNTAVPTTVGLLADTIRNPQITEEEIAQQLDTADYEIREIWSKPDMILPEMVNVAAYRGNTLGNPLLCPQERLQFINKAVVDKYRAVFYHPERMILAFAGVSHEQGLRLAEQYFGDMSAGQPPILSQLGSETTLQDSETSSQFSADSSDSSTSASSPYTTTYTTPSPTSSTISQQPSRLAKNIPFLKNLSTSASAQASISHIQPTATGDLLPFNTPSHYTGGFLELPQLPPPPTPNLPDLSYVHLGFEALPISSNDIYALAALQTLLGGGGSFSAGGPGKGMYSRLYTNVLNQYGWVDSCIAFNNAYSDSGVFGIAGSCEPRNVKTMIDVMCRQLHDVCGDSGYSSLQPAEVNRAKNQLRSSLLMNLESRMVELEDLGRQVQVHGRKVGVKEMCQKIDSLTVGDLKRVARLVFRGKVQNAGKGSGAPTVVLQEGSTAPKGLINWDDIQERIRRWGLGRR